MPGNIVEDQVMKTFGWCPREEEWKEMVNVIDQDGDGDISFNEFVWLMTRCLLLKILILPTNYL